MGARDAGAGGGSQPASLRSAYRLALFFFGTTLGLLILCGWLLVRAFAPDDSRGNDPGLRGEAVQELVGRALGIHDTFPDPEVGRILQPGIEGRRIGVHLVDTNEHGLRERSFSIERPENTVRVILLGDSFVYGAGVAAEDRLGVALERELASRARNRELAVEVLHFGVPSWNVVSECAFLRRQLSVLRPDLVVHIVVGNDLNDVAGSRGFGALSSFSDAHRGRADSLVYLRFPDYELDGRQKTWLNRALDHESRSRYREAAAALGRLEKSVNRCGGTYRVIAATTLFARTAMRYLFSSIPADRVLPMPASFMAELENRVARDDAHWSPLGHERMAEMLYGMIREQGLLERLSPGSWPEAEDRARRMIAEGMADAEREPDERRVRRREAIRKGLRFAELDGHGKAQLYGGFDREGRIGPYASMILRSAGTQSLLVEARRLGRPELEGVVEVFVDERSMGTIELAGEGEVRFEAPMPPVLREREFVTVRFEAPDFVYDATDLRQTLALELVSVELR